jgi:hypothetical protein
MTLRGIVCKSFGAILFVALASGICTLRQTCGCSRGFRTTGSRNSGPPAFLGKGGTLNSITADKELIGVINTPEFAELVREFSQKPTK